MDLAAGKPVVEQALAFARDAGQTVLIYATSTPDEVKAVQKELGVERSGAMVEAALGEIAKGLLDAGVRRFVVAGGETSGGCRSSAGRAIAADRAHRSIRAFRPPSAGGAQPLALALKSGNFGARDFFAKALKQLAGAA
ncbi:hypothetical protein CU663_19745 [Pseudomonas syringae pv. actinidifoliorum]|nr:hypothetical protein [Pseudomonas syringae pv. actinidifoliorum]